VTYKNTDKDNRVRTKSICDQFFENAGVPRKPTTYQGDKVRLSMTMILVLCGLSFSKMNMKVESAMLGSLQTKRNGQMSNLEYITIDVSYHNDSDDTLSIINIAIDVINGEEKKMGLLYLSEYPYKVSFKKGKEHGAINNGSINGVANSDDRENSIGGLERRAPRNLQNNDYDTKDMLPANMFIKINPREKIRTSMRIYPTMFGQKDFDGMDSIGLNYEISYDNYFRSKEYEEFNKILVDFKQRIPEYIAGMKSLNIRGRRPMFVASEINDIEKLIQYQNCIESITSVSAKSDYVFINR